MNKPLTKHMDNIHALWLGRAALQATNNDKAKTLIDRGLILLELLNEAGYSVIATNTGHTK